jgi:prepilin-type N-terminal cleavage/methylation domain-containing protein
MIKRLRKQRGFGLVEVIIALGLLGIIGIAFLSALAISSTAIMTSDKHATAESLARSEMEFVKSQDYSGEPWSYHLRGTSPDGTSPTGNFPDWWVMGSHKLPDGYENYTATVEATLLDPMEDGDGNDDGLQKITVTITFPKDSPEETTVIALEGYKAG